MKKMPLLLLSSSLLYTSLFASSLSKTENKDSLIVYNSNIGLVHERRDLSIATDEKTIVYEGIAQSIEVDSINVSLPKGVQLKSQQYRFDKLTQSKLLEAHIDKSIEVRLPRDGQTFKIISVTLLSSEGEKALVRASDGNIITVESDAIIFKNIPTELITKASLVWNVDVLKDTYEAMELDYSIQDIAWQSNYILRLEKDKASLDGWISVENRSGKSYDEVDLYLLAGDINRASTPPVLYKQARAMIMDESAPVGHQAHEGYHFYTVPFKVSLANNEKTQIKFITKTDIAVQRKQSVTLSNPNYLNAQQEHDVTQFVSLSALDIALPKGVVRTYSKLEETNILLGESALAHTPKESAIYLELGKSFDLKVIESVESKDDTKETFASSVKYTLKNNSDEEKTIELLIPFNKGENAKVTTKQAFTYTKGNLLTFNVTVGAMSSKEIMVNFVSGK